MEHAEQHAKSVSREPGSSQSFIVRPDSHTAIAALGNS